MPIDPSASREEKQAYLKAQLQGPELTLQLENERIALTIEESNRFCKFCGHKNHSILTDEMLFYCDVISCTCGVSTCIDCKQVVRAVSFTHNSDQVYCLNCGYTSWAIWFA